MEAVWGKDKDHVPDIRVYLKRVRTQATLQHKLDTLEYPIENAAFMKQGKQYGGIASMWRELRGPVPNAKNVFDTTVWRPRVTSISKNPQQKARVEATETLRVELKAQLAQRESEKQV